MRHLRKILYSSVAVVLIGALLFGTVIFPGCSKLTEPEAVDLGTLEKAGVTESNERGIPVILALLIIPFGSGFFGSCLAASNDCSKPKYGVFAAATFLVSMRWVAMNPPVSVGSQFGGMILGSQTCQAVTDALSSFFNTSEINKDQPYTVAIDWGRELKLRDGMYLNIDLDNNPNNGFEAATYFAGGTNLRTYYNSSCDRSSYYTTSNECENLRAYYNGGWYRVGTHLTPLDFCGKKRVAISRDYVQVPLAVACQ